MAGTKWKARIERGLMRTNIPLQEARRSGNTILASPAQKVEPRSGTGEDRSLPFPAAVWRGVFAEYREWVGDREGCDAYDFVAFAAAAGLRLGRRVWLPYDQRLYPNFYVVVHGAT